MADIFNGLRFIIAIKSCGRRVMYKTFCIGVPNKDNYVNLCDYLENLHPTSSANYLKVSSKNRKFDETQNEMILRSPDCSEFDVSLLHKSIKLACDNVAPYNDPKWWTPSTEMEYYITAIKKMRNDAIHSQLSITGQELMEKTVKLRELLIGCLKTSGERYGRDEAEVDKEIKQVKDELDHIEQEILGEEDLMKYCFNEIKHLMIQESNKSLKKAFQNLVYINPVDFITSKLRLKVNDIFVDIEVEKGKGRSDGKHTNYRNLLELVQSTDAPPTVSVASQQQVSSSRPQILLLEGLAGSGKTTLVTMVTQDWIKEGQSNIHGLDNYDLMLWVQCRDPTIHSYQDLLDRLMPDVSLKFRNLLPRLTKLCKLLIIVDGLDEINENSKKILESLLYEFKNSLHTTFLCTSRPEKLEMFKMTIPQEYNVINAELRGIPEHLMIQFVCLSHREIKKLTKSQRSTKQLVKLVKKLKGLHEHLTLPMNLIFLVYIWDQAPGELSSMTVTHTELYYKIHRLCLRKLFQRLANHPQTKTMSQEKLNNKIQVILREIYRITLESLSRDQLTLERETVDQLTTACDKQGLPHEELLSAFLSMKPTWTWEGVQEQYSAPHKGIQDYYSAIHIVTTLKCQLQSSALRVTYNQRPRPLLFSPAYPTPVSSTPASATQASPTPASSTSASPTPASPTPASPGIIREVLTQTIKPAEVDMSKYQNVLVHVAGLLHLTLDQVPEAPAQEVVYLLYESGMRDEYHWLDLLENTNVTLVTIKAVARFINTGQYINISDSRVGSYAALLPHLKTAKVSIDIKSDPADLPRLPDLLVGLAHHHCVHLSLRHHYYNADTATTSDHLLQCVQPQSSLEEFWGHLSGDGVAALPPSLRQLSLAVMTDDHARCLLPQLHAVVTSRLPHLWSLQVHVLADVSPAVLVPLPGTDRVDLDLSGVSDAGVSRASHVASNLQPPGGYYIIRFPSATLTEAGYEDLVHNLAERGVIVKMLEVPRSQHLTEQQEAHIVTLAEATLDCGFLRLLNRNKGEPSKEEEEVPEDE